MLLSIFIDMEDNGQKYKNGNLMRRVIYIVTAIVAVIVAQIIADNLLDGSFV